MEENYVLAFAFTIFAGLATGIGSALAFFTKRTNKTFLSIALGFSAGVMIYVSFAEILVKGQEALTAAHGERVGTWYAVLSFFGGILLILVIDRLVPSYENPHEPHTVDETTGPPPEEARLFRMGLLTALAIAIHNFPEGLATFMGALADPKLGLSIAVAIAIHNIPEGISVSVPILSLIHISEPTRPY